MFSSNEEVRIPAAELYALIVSSALDDEKITDIIDEMCENIHKQVYSVSCVSYLRM